MAHARTPIAAKSGAIAKVMPAMPAFAAT